MRPCRAVQCGWYGEAGDCAAPHAACKLRRYQTIDALLFKHAEHTRFADRRHPEARRADSVPLAKWADPIRLPLRRGSRLTHFPLGPGGFRRVRGACACAHAREHSVRRRSRPTFSRRSAARGTCRAATRSSSAGCAADSPFRAAWDPMPRGTPCRAEYHAARDPVPRGTPCRAGRGDRAAHTVQCGAHDCAAHRTFRFTSFQSSCAKSAGTQAAELAEVGEALQADGYRRPY
jgi:hypothetical protein